MQNYRYVSALLIFVFITLPIILALMGAPKWSSFALALPFAFILIVLSYYRMVDAGMSPGWVWLMILMLNFGPSVELPGITLYLSNLIHLVPVAIGWIVPARANGSAEVPSGINSCKPAA